MKPLEQKFNHLNGILAGYKSLIVAYSGGVDSVFLAKVAHDTLGEKSLAIISDSSSLPRRELAEALAIGRQLGFHVRVVRTREMASPEYKANPSNRCYFCKHELFKILAPIAIAENFAIICYGENASDASDDRPGALAAAEFAIKAPLKEAGLTKAEIRELSRLLGLPTADKPSMACLSSRLPHGEEVTVKKLAMIEAAENVLRDAGFYDVRVRHHELCGQEKNASQSVSVPSRALARIEVSLGEMNRLVDKPFRDRLITALKEIGYAYVTLDLCGYRRHSVDGVPRTRPETQRCGVCNL